MNDSEDGDAYTSFITSCSHCLPVCWAGPRKYIFLFPVTYVLQTRQIIYEIGYSDEKLLPDQNEYKDIQLRLTISLLLLESLILLNVYFPVHNITSTSKLLLNITHR